MLCRRSALLSCVVGKHYDVSSVSTVLCRRLALYLAREVTVIYAGNIAQRHIKLQRQVKSTIEPGKPTSAQSCEESKPKTTRPRNKRKETDGQKATGVHDVPSTVLGVRLRLSVCLISPWLAPLATKWKSPVKKEPAR